MISLCTCLVRLLETGICGTFIEWKNLQQGWICLLKTFARCMAMHHLSCTVSLTYGDWVGLELPCVTMIRMWQQCARASKVEPAVMRLTCPLSLGLQMHQVYDQSFSGKGVWKFNRLKRSLICDIGALALIFALKLMGALGQEGFV